MPLRLKSKVKEAKGRAEAPKMEDEAGRGPRSPAHRGKPQEQKQEEPEARDAETDCWTVSLPSRICLAGSETLMARLTASTPLRDPPSRIRTVPLGPLPWMDRFCSQLWPNVTYNERSLSNCLSRRRKSKTSPLGLLLSQRCIHRVIFSGGEGTLDTRTGFENQRPVRTAGDEGKLKHTLSFFPNPSGFTACPPLPS